MRLTLLVNSTDCSLRESIWSLRCLIPACINTWFVNWKWPARLHFWEPVKNWFSLTGAQRRLGPVSVQLLGVPNAIEKSSQGSNVVLCFYTAGPKDALELLRTLISQTCPWLSFPLDPLGCKVLRIITPQLVQTLLLSFHFYLVSFPLRSKQCFASRMTLCFSLCVWI